MHTCPVCGYDQLEDQPADYMICPCCGTEFGDDDAGVTHADLRAQWIANGSQWWSKTDATPAGWSAKEQLARLGLER